jgi:hypothetical protein
MEPPPPLLYLKENVATYAQIRAGEFGGGRNEETKDNWFSKGLIVCHIFPESIKPLFIAPKRIFGYPGFLVYHQSFIFGNVPRAEKEY